MPKPPPPTNPHPSLAHLTSPTHTHISSKPPTQPSHISESLEGKTWTNTRALRTELLASKLLIERTEGDSYSPKIGKLPEGMACKERSKSVFVQLTKDIETNRGRKEMDCKRVQEKMFNDECSFQPDLSLSKDLDKERILSESGGEQPDFLTRVKTASEKTKQTQSLAALHAKYYDVTNNVELFKPAVTGGGGSGEFKFVKSWRSEDFDEFGFGEDEEYGDGDGDGDGDGSDDEHGLNGYGGDGDVEIDFLDGELFTDDHMNADNDDDDDRSVNNILDSSEHSTSNSRPNRHLKPPPLSQSHQYMKTTKALYIDASQRLTRLSTNSSILEQQRLADFNRSKLTLKNSNIANVRMEGRVKVGFDFILNSSSSSNSTSSDKANGRGVEGEKGRVGFTLIDLIRMLKVYVAKRLISDRLFTCADPSEDSDYLYYEVGRELFDVFSKGGDDDDDYDVVHSDTEEVAVDDAKVVTYKKYLKIALPCCTSNTLSNGYASVNDSSPLKKSSTSSHKGSSPTLSETSNSNYTFNSTSHSHSPSLSKSSPLEGKHYYPHTTRNYNPPSSSPHSKLPFSPSSSLTSPIKLSSQHQHEDSPAMNDLPYTPSSQYSSQLSYSSSSNHLHHHSQTLQKHITSFCRASVQHGISRSSEIEVEGMIKDREKDYTFRPAVNEYSREIDSSVNLGNSKGVGDNVSANIGSKDKGKDKDRNSGIINRSKIWSAKSTAFKVKLDLKVKEKFEKEVEGCTFSPKLYRKDYFKGKNEKVKVKVKVKEKVMDDDDFITLEDTDTDTPKSTPKPISTVHEYLQTNAHDRLYNKWYNNGQHTQPSLKVQQLKLEQEVREMEVCTFVPNLIKPSSGTSGSNGSSASAGNGSGANAGNGNSAGGSGEGSVSIKPRKNVDEWLVKNKMNKDKKKLENVQNRDFNNVIHTDTGARVKGKEKEKEGFKFGTEIYESSASRLNKRYANSAKGGSGGGSGKTQQQQQLSKPHHASHQNQTTKMSKQPTLFIDIKLTPAKTGRIGINRYDEPEHVLERFCSVYRVAGGRVVKGRLLEVFRAQIELLRGGDDKGVEGVVV